GVVDDLQRAIEAEDDLSGRVLGRLRPADVASVMFLHQPDALAQLEERLPPDTELPDLVEAGVVHWLGALERQIMAGLDGVEGDSDDDATALDDGGEPDAREPAGHALDPKEAMAG